MGACLFLSVELSLHRMMTFVWKEPNAVRQPRSKAEAERTLEGVACTRLILIEAPSSADHGGMLTLGKC